MLLPLSRRSLGAWRASVCVAALALPGLAQDGTPLQTFMANAAEDNFGTSVDVAGDVDGDTIPDYVVGAYLNDAGGPEAGQVIVFSGADGSTLHTFDGDAAGDQLGFSVAGAGDVNNDGRADVIAGADLGNYARVYSGADGSVLHTFVGTLPDDLFGTSVASAGDLDFDGRADVIVGAPAEDAANFDEGFARVYSGSVLHTFTGRISGTGLGRSVASAGFIDGDGVPDVIVGANNGSNIAVVFSGASGAVIHTLFGDSGLDWFGTSIAGIGDIDGDGRGDLVVGAPQGFLGPGYARVFSGATGAVIREHTGFEFLGLFGWDVTGLGDVDGDLRPDYAIGSPFEDAGGTFNAGHVRAYSGATGALIFNATGVGDESLLGWSLGATPCADLIAGAPVAGLGGEAQVLNSGQSTVDCPLVLFEPSPALPLLRLPARRLR